MSRRKCLQHVKRAERNQARGGQTVCGARGCGRYEAGPDKLGHAHSAIRNQNEGSHRGKAELNAGLKEREIGRRHDRNEVRGKPADLSDIQSERPGRLETFTVISELGNIDAIAIIVPVMPYANWRLGGRAGRKGPPGTIGRSFVANWYSPPALLIAKTSAETVRR